MEKGRVKRIVFRVKEASVWRRGSAFGVPCGGMPKGWGWSCPLGMLISREEGSGGKSDLMLRVKEC